MPGTNQPRRPGTQPSFQRARRSDQIDQRRHAICSAARGLLSERRLPDITLADIAARAGIAPSGVLRYFDSREAVFGQILGDEIDDWIDELNTRVAGSVAAGEPWRNVERFAAAMATTIVHRSALCQLLAASAAILEHNITLASAIAFKQRNLGQIERLAHLLRRNIKELSPAATAQFCSAAADIVSASWAHAQPSATAAEAIRALDYPSVANDYEGYLSEVLANQLAGALVRGGRTQVRV